MAIMFRRARQLYSRILLVMMLATFLSPSLGWGMVASHEQLSDSITAADNTDFAHDHDHPSVPDDSHDHQDAHASIGHLLTHMSVSFFVPFCLDILPVAQSKSPFLHLAVLQADLEPLLRPPRTNSRI